MTGRFQEMAVYFFGSGPYYLYSRGTLTTVCILFPVLFNVFTRSLSPLTLLSGTISFFFFGPSRANANNSRSPRPSRATRPGVVLTVRVVAGRCCRSHRPRAASACPWAHQQARDHLAPRSPRRATICGSLLTSTPQLMLKLCETPSRLSSPLARLCLRRRVADQIRERETIVRGDEVDQRALGRRRPWWKRSFDPASPPRRLAARAAALE